jgi:hypothetical protein
MRTVCANDAKIRVRVTPCDDNPLNRSSFALAWTSATIADNCERKS